MKKVIALVMAVLTLVVFTACAAPAAAPAAPAAEPAAAPAAAPAAEPAAEPAGVPGDVNGDGVIKVGLNLSNTANFYYMVWDSVGDECAKRGWELVTPTFGMNDKVLENDRNLLAQNIDFLIDFGCNEEFQNAARELCDQQGVFVIGVDVPSGGDSSFVGADNKAAGILLGETLGDWVNENWGGQVDKVFLSYAELNGEIVKMRTHGVPEGLKNKGIEIAEADIFYSDTPLNEDTQEDFRNYLEANPDAHHIVVASVTENQGPYLTAAAESVGRGADVVIGTNSESNVFIDYQNDFPGNPWYCTVAYSFERYGEYCFKILDDIVAGKTPPKEMLMDHVCVTQENYKDWEWLCDYKPKYA